MNVRAIWVCMAMGGFGLPAIAQPIPPSIKVGDTRIEVGDSSARVISALQKSYLVSVANENAPVQDWLVQTDKKSVPIAEIYVKHDQIVRLKTRLQ